MKTFIYLPLIALIILTGCKSNSFNSQRYTKFGHAAHKSTSHEAVATVKKQKVNTVTVSEPVETETVKNSSGPVQLVASGMSSLKESILKPERKVYSLNSGSQDISSTSESISKDENLNTENSNTTVKSQKSVSQNKQHQRGLIGSAFATALWIVLVVIFICLIIFVIAAVF